MPGRRLNGSDLEKQLTVKCCIAGKRQRVWSDFCCLKIVGLVTHTHHIRSRSRSPIRLVGGLMSLSAHGALDDVLSTVTTPCHNALCMECMLALKTSRFISRANRVKANRAGLLLFELYDRQSGFHLLLCDRRLHEAISSR
mmetsp:Transcript_36550/g.85662  ORF Transcript_36550/g.85662 Transcript_36550/m.85662 type:complete len:141 (+) Transcript_36550:88-510(+)